MSQSVTRVSNSQPFSVVEISTFQTSISFGGTFSNASLKLASLCNVLFRLEMVIFFGTWTSKFLLGWSPKSRQFKVKVVIIGDMALYFFSVIRCVWIENQGNIG